jgi:hypothetical protein
MLEETTTDPVVADVRNFFKVTSAGMVSRDPLVKIG